MKSIMGAILVAVALFFIFNSSTLTEYLIVLGLVSLGLYLMKK